MEGGDAAVDCKSAAEVSDCIRNGKKFTINASLVELKLECTIMRSLPLLLSSQFYYCFFFITFFRKYILINIIVVSVISHSEAEHIAEALNVNSSLTQLDLNCASHPRTHLLIRIRPRPPTRVLVDAHRRRIVSSSS